MIISLVFSKINTLKEDMKVRDFFLQAIFKSAHNLSPTFSFNETSLQICLQGEEKELLDFCNTLQNIIPLSLQWTFKELVQVTTPYENSQLDFKNFSYFSPQELANITQKNSSNFCNLWQNFIGYQQEKLTLIENGEKIPIQNAKDLQIALDKISKKLIAKEEVFIKTSMGKKSLVLLDENTPTPINEDFIFMPFCLNSAQTFFVASKEELEALATLEKPIISLRHKSIFKDFFPTREVSCILPYDPILLLLAQFLENYNGLYLLPIGEEKIQNGICAFFAKDIPSPKITLGSNAIIIPHIFKQTNILQAFKYKIEEEELHNINALYIGKEESLVLMYLQQTFKLTLPISFQTNPKLILKTLNTFNETTQKLVKNFTTPNETTIHYLQSFQEESRISKNILDLIGVCGLFLGFSTKENLEDALKEAYNNLLLNAKNFMGNKGPRIDFKLEKNEEGIFLNPLKTICSTMSFHLAGVDKELLSFGILDSLAEFFANFLRDLEENYQTKNVLICGELFTNKQFLDQFIHYYPKFSEILPLDFCDIIPTKVFK